VYTVAMLSNFRS